jgi:hypothetical protein
MTDAVDTLIRFVEEEGQILEDPNIYIPKDIFAYRFRTYCNRLGIAPPSNEAIDHIVLGCLPKVEADKNPFLGGAEAIWRNLTLRPEPRPEPKEEFTYRGHFVKRPNRIQLIESIIFVLKAESPLSMRGIHEKLWNLKIGTSKSELLGALNSPQGRELFAYHKLRIRCNTGMSMRAHYYLADQAGVQHG